MSLQDRLLKLAGIVSKGAEAQAELKVLGEAFQHLRERLVESWQATDPRDAIGREKLWLATTQLTQVERALRTVAQNGMIADKEIEVIKKAGDARKRPLRTV